MSIGFPLAGLLVCSWIIEEFGFVIGLITACVLAANYYFIMRKFK